MDGACELFSDLSISLLGQPLTAQDILTAEIQPRFSACGSLCSIGPLSKATPSLHPRLTWNSSQILYMLLGMSDPVPI